MFLREKTFFFYLKLLYKIKVVIKMKLIKNKKKGEKRSIQIDLFME